MARNIHGTRSDSKKRHPVLDLRHWEREFPLGGDRNLYSINGPGDVARAEQARRLALAKGDLGPSVPSDVFVWSDGYMQGEVDLLTWRGTPWLTRIGGRPWRPEGRPWPKDEETGRPLVFLGQICFVDSRDILPCELPGDVALIFGNPHPSWITVEPGALEWSSIEIDEPCRHSEWGAELPYEYQGVIHRTVQYTSWEGAEPAFEAAGFEDGGWQVRAMQATSIGTHANLPQGWPFEEGDGNTLIATLSSFYFRRRWPLCDVPLPLQGIRRNGTQSDAWNNGALKFGVGDAGCIWIYRDRNGQFHLDEACG